MNERYRLTPEQIRDFVTAFWDKHEDDAMTQSELEDLLDSELVAAAAEKAARLAREDGLMEVLTLLMTDLTEQIAEWLAKHDAALLHNTQARTMVSTGKLWPERDASDLLRFLSSLRSGQKEERG